MTPDEKEKLFYMAFGFFLAASVVALSVLIYSKLTL